MIRALASLLLCAAASSEAAAQWSVTADVAAARFWGASSEKAGDRSFRPYRPTIVGLGVERRIGGVGVEVRGYYASASLALEGNDAVVAVKDAMEVYGVALEGSTPLASIGREVRVVFLAGPLIESWSLAGETSHLRAGFNSAIGMQLSLGGRWSAIMRGGVGVGGSPFSDDDLDAGFAPRALWRRELAGRLSYRL